MKCFCRREQSWDWGLAALYINTARTFGIPQPGAFNEWPLCVNMPKEMSFKYWVCALYRIHIYSRIYGQVKRVFPDNTLQAWGSFSSSLGKLQCLNHSSVTKEGATQFAFTPLFWLCGSSFVTGVSNLVGKCVRY